MDSREINPAGAVNLVPWTSSLWSLLACSAGVFCGDRVLSIFFALCLGAILEYEISGGLGRVFKRAFARHKTPALQARVTLTLTLIFFGTFPPITPFRGRHLFSVMVQQSLNHTVQKDVGHLIETNITYYNSTH